MCSFSLFSILIAVERGQGLNFADSFSTWSSIFLTSFMSFISCCLWTEISWGFFYIISDWKNPVHHYKVISLLFKILVKSRVTTLYILYKMYIVSKKNLHFCTFFFTAKIVHFCTFFTKKNVYFCTFFFTTKIAEFSSLTISIKRKYVILFYQMIFLCFILCTY